MSRTIYYVASTIDGFIADAEDKLDWLFQFNDVPGVGAHYEAFMKRIGAIAMGARTYEFLLNQSHEPWPYSGTPTWVFTHRNLPKIDGADLRFTTGPIEKVHAELIDAAKGKDVWLVGGGELVAQFARVGLLDEVHLSLVPVTLGAGRPLLPANLRTPWKLDQITRFGEGMVELRYTLPASSSR